MSPKGREREERRYKSPEHLAYKRTIRSNGGLAPSTTHEKSGTRLDVRRALIIGDIQFPWHDETALELVLRIAKDTQPDCVVLNGDITDCVYLSAFDKNPAHGPEILSLEIALARGLLARLDWIEQKWWLGGNHEDRWRRQIWRARSQDNVLLSAVHALKVESFDQLIGMWDFGFRWLPYVSYVDLGHLMITHGELVSVHSGVSAKRHYEKYGRSVVIGHTHRQGAYTKTTRDGIHGAWETGCLCRLDPQWSFFPNWQQGFIIVDVSPHTGFFHVTQIPIIAAVTTEGAELYTARYAGQEWAITKDDVRPLVTTLEPTYIRSSAPERSLTHGPKR